METVRKRRQSRKKKAAPAEELSALRKQAENAKAALESAERDAEAAIHEVRKSVQKAKEVYHKGVAPYRIACRKAGEKCDFSTSRSSNVSAQVSFEVDKTKSGVRVMLKGQPKTEEVISFATLKQSVNQAAYAYTDKHVGSREKVGNKGGSLSNRLRAVLK